MSQNEEYATISGRYVFVPNPCTTEPCLPGMAYAIESDEGECFFLTLGGSWSDRPFDWNGWKPSLGEVICAKGKISRQTDRKGNLFATIEVEALAPAV